MTSARTRCVTGSRGDHDGVVLPIDPSTAFRYIRDGERTYPRCFNTPNQRVLAKKIASLEHADSGLVFSSGMAAISTTLLALLSPGDHVIVPASLYGGTRSFVASEFQRIGIEYDLVSDEFLDDMASEISNRVRSNTRLVYVESPTNPRLDLISLSRIAECAADHQLATVVDNTFATPINQTPIDFGISLVVHSGTKYLGGHSDLTCGAVVGPEDLLAKIVEVAANYGGSLNSLDGYLLDRSLKTLAVRVERQNKNAMATARFLQSHPAIARVLYPGLETHRHHELAGAQMNGFGGMVTFELRPDRSVTEFLQGLKLVTPAISLGGVESTMCLPAFTSHLELTKEERLACGVTERLVRFSVGIEDQSDIVSDLEQAIEQS